MRLYALRHRDRINTMLKAIGIAILATLILVGMLSSVFSYIDMLAEDKARTIINKERAALADELREATYLRGANRELLAVLNGNAQMQVDEGGAYVMPAALSCKGGFVKVDWSIERKDSSL